MALSQPIKPMKRSDLVAQEIKRLIAEKNLSPGDRLPRESELQAQFQVSKGTIREALKSLEVQGLISISTGPSGGGTIVEVPLDRTLQFMQNYLFFQEVTIADIYGVRQLLEPELAAGAVLHLTDEHFHALEHSIECCDPHKSDADLLQQRHEDVHFHDILAQANPNPFLRFTCELINEMIRQLIVFGNRTPQSEHRRFGKENADFHRDILAASRARDVEKVRSLMQAHMASATSNVQRMKGRLQGRLILDGDTLRRVGPAMDAMAFSLSSARSLSREGQGIQEGKRGEKVATETAPKAASSSGKKRISRQTETVAKNEPLAVTLPAKKAPRKAVVATKVKSPSKKIAGSHE